VRGKTSLVAGAVAALALILTGCGGGEDGKSAGADDKPKQKSSASASPKKSSSPSTRPSASKSAGPSAKPSVKPKPSSARPTSKAPAPRPSTGSGSTGGQGGGGAAPASVQGTWYYPFLLQGKAITMTVSGSTFTATGNGKSCSGTINSSMRIASSCGGKYETGRAVLGEGGQKLTFQWNGNQPDRFQRQRPQ